MGPLAGVGAVVHSQCGPLDELLAAAVPVALVGSLSSVDSAMSGQIRAAGKGLCAVFPDALVRTLGGDGALSLGGAAAILGVLLVVHVVALGIIVQINVEIEVNVGSILVVVSLELLLLQSCLWASRVEHASDVHGWNRVGNVSMSMCECVCVCCRSVCACGCVAMTRCLWQVWLVLGLGMEYDMQGEERTGPKKNVCVVRGTDRFAMFCDVVYENVCV